MTELKRKRGDSDHDDHVDTSQFCMHARHSWLANNVTTLKMPWDFKLVDQFDRISSFNSGLLRTVGTMPPLPAVEGMSTDDATSSQAYARSDPSFGPKALQNAHKRSWHEKVDYERKCAYRKWISIVSANPMAFEVARLQILSGPMEFAKGGLAESISDALGNKSSSTLHSRAGPLLRFIKFCNDRDIPCFPLEEHKVYDFIKSIDNCAPSFPRSFMLSVSFATHILGLMGGVAACDSKRVQGAVKLHFEQRAKVRQRPPLTVKQIITLEQIVTSNNKSIYDRIMAGYFLMMVYGRLRFSDGQRITGMRLEIVHVDSKPVGFLECAAERTKTSIALERKVRFLPIAVPVQSLSQPAWLPVWNQLRADQGMMASDRTSTLPVMPSPAVGGGWSQAPLGVTPAGEWLRNLLRHTETVGRIRVATHSCKTTLLAWCSRAGLSHDDRRLLGYHSSSSDKSLLVYSRDAMAQPLRGLIDLIDKVAAGKFAPDLTRSGMFAREAGAAQDDQSSISSSSCGSEDEDDKDVFEEEVAIEQVAGAWQPEAKPTEQAAAFVRHITSRCIHRMMDEGGTHLACGRSMSARYEVQAERPKFFHPVCGTCFRDAQA
eukprot:s723_g12.t1